MNSLQMTFTAGAASIGIIMQNAGSNQRNGQVIANAATTMTCAKILKAPLASPKP